MLTQSSTYWHQALNRVLHHSQQELAGPELPPHFSEGPMSIPSFDISVLNIPAKDAALSPVTEQDNTLLGLALGPPVKSTGLSHSPGGGLLGRGSGQASGADSPMSVGSPTGVG